PETYTLSLHDALPIYMLAIVQSIAMQTFRHSEVPPALKESFQARLSALAAAHDALSDTRTESAALRRVVERALQPYGAGGEGRIDRKSTRLNSSHSQI